jgi:hypothetical protein
MSSKKGIFLLTATVFLASFVVLAIPQASALTRNTFDDSHTTALYGNSKVCGSHLCAKGEHSKWYNAIWQSQKLSFGKTTGIKQGEDVLQHIVGTTQAPATSTSMNMTGSAGNTMQGNR